MLGGARGREEGRRGEREEGRKERGEMVKVSFVWSDSGKEVFADAITIEDESIKGLRKAIQEEVRKGGGGKKAKKLTHEERIRVSIPATTKGVKPTPLPAVSSESLEKLGVKENMKLVLKDLGPQVPYATVFFYEYLGPLLLYPVFFFLPKLIYGVDVKHCEAQTLACAYWSFHYAKRIYETYYVHTFSHGTMPRGNLIKNCSYYWLSAAGISYFINHPLYTSPPVYRVALGFAVACVCQYFNYDSHVRLAKLRAPGSGAGSGYKIPRGGLFEYVTCANYAAEIYGWLAFNVATQSVLGIVFMCAGAWQMAIWAAAKQKRLKKLFDGKDGREKYPKNRWLVIPPFI